MPLSELKNYQAFAEDLARQGGAFLNRRLGKIQEVSFKGRMNLVTDIDTGCERLIIRGIRKRFPRHQVLSEEAGRIEGGGSDLCWLIDPLDGTTNYVHSFPFFCVSIALSKAGKVAVGVVYDPLRNELFSARRDGGAYLNNKKIRVTGTSKLLSSLLITGFPYKFGRSMRRNIDNFTRFIMRAQAVRRPGSAALDLCYVAAGRADAFWELELKPWDTAAGAVIVEEAGGRVTTFGGKKFDPFKKEIVASNSSIHNKMLKVLA